MCIALLRLGVASWTAGAQHLAERVMPLAPAVHATMAQIALEATPGDASPRSQSTVADAMSRQVIRGLLRVAADTAHEAIRTLRGSGTLLGGATDGSLPGPSSRSEDDSSPCTCSVPSERVVHWAVDGSKGQHAIARRELCNWMGASSS